MYSNSIKEIKALYSRVILSYSDLYDAFRSVKRLIELDEFDRSLLDQSPDFVANMVCFIVSYGRPFIRSKDSKIAFKKLPDDALGTLTKQEKLLHDRIIELRHTEFAHSDPGPAQIDIKIIKYDGQNFGLPLSRVTRLPFSKSDILLADNIIRKIGNWIDTQLVEIPNQLPPDEII
jgi:hypothetical protein